MSDTNTVLTFTSTSLHDKGEPISYNENSSNGVTLKETQEATHYCGPISDAFKQKHTIACTVMVPNAGSTSYIV